MTYIYEEICEEKYAFVCEKRKDNETYGRYESTILNFSLALLSTLAPAPEPPPSAVTPQIQSFSDLSSIH